MAQVHAHMQDYEAHVRAVEEDLEYYRTKRLEPRILYLHRRGIVTLYDILRAFARLAPDAASAPPAGAASQDLAQRIRALEDGLDEYVRGIALTTIEVGGQPLPIEETRKERGDYDPFFRIAKKPHGGSLEERIARLEQDLRDYTLLLQAFTRALVETGAVTEAQLAEQRAALTGRGAWNGARIVARAWVDPEFKHALLTKGREAVRELDIPPGRLGKLGVAENTETVHNVVVCTLCSCYPYDLLGDTPWWYKHDTYKERIVRDPRGTLEEMFGLKIPPTMEIRVHDSTSDVRWMVLPRRPAGTEGWSEAELARLVTPESLIGVSEPLSPDQLAAAPAAPAVRQPRGY
ncbi:MAG TPA: nitrile hydratase subunit alpha [Chloroflexota bacterium]|nr:nitrile hydratase subunit alpha [Chloroflexota bacterium]